VAKYEDLDLAITPLACRREVKDDAQRPVKE